jgi:hypothetical protein
VPGDVSSAGSKDGSPFTDERVAASRGRADDGTGRRRQRAARIPGVPGGGQDCTAVARNSTGRHTSMHDRSGISIAMRAGPIIR